MKELIKKILSIADKSYYNYKKQERPIISLLEKYFTEKDLKEFIETGEISSYHTFHLHQQRIEKSFEITLDLINDTMDFEGLYIYFKFFSKYKNILFEKIKDNENKRGIEPNKINTFIQYYLNKFYYEENLFESDLEYTFAQFSIFLLETKFEFKSYIISSFYSDFKYLNDKEIQKICNELKNPKNLEDFFKKYQKIYLK